MTVLSPPGFTFPRHCPSFLAVRLAGKVPSGCPQVRSLHMFAVEVLIVKVRPVHHTPSAPRILL